MRRHRNLAHASRLYFYSVKAHLRFTAFCSMPEHQVNLCSKVVTSLRAETAGLSSSALAVSEAVVAVGDCCPGHEIEYATLFSVEAADSRAARRLVLDLVKPEALVRIEEPVRGERVQDESLMRHSSAPVLPGFDTVAGPAQSWQKSN